MNLSGECRTRHANLRASNSRRLLNFDADSRVPMILVIARRYARRSGVLSWLEGNLPHPDLGLRDKSTQRQGRYKGREGDRDRKRAKERKDLSRGNKIWVDVQFISEDEARPRRMFRRVLFQDLKSQGPVIDYDNRFA
jgi:hypothetical protein